MFIDKLCRYASTFVESKYKHYMLFNVLPPFIVLVTVPLI